MFRPVSAIAASLLYIVAASLLIVRSVNHYEVLVVALQFTLLLPAIFYCLRLPDLRSNVVIFSLSRVAFCVITAFFVLSCLIFIHRISKGITFADESSYQFQARAFASLRKVGSAPPVASVLPHSAVQPLAFKHIILSNSSRFSKYPFGWPAVLALGENFNLGWAVTPLLGGMLLIVLGLVAYEVFGATAVLPSAWMAVLSPYFFANCTGKMSHALCAILISLACLFCFRGIRTSSMSQFGFMFATLVINFHVRPFTAFVVSIILSAAVLHYYRRNYSMLTRLALMAGVFGLITVASVLFYNHAYTGKYLLSPYALYDGRTIPTDISPTPSVIFANLASNRRISMQTTLLYSFPFVFFLAAYGFWIERRLQPARILAILFPAIFIAHLIQPFSSSPIVGERYYFEAYFAVVVLAAYGAQTLLLRMRSQKRSVILVAVLLTTVQGAMSIVAARQIDLVNRPYRKVSKIADTYQDCKCVVFLKSSGPQTYFSPNLDFNLPTWKPGETYYLNDPGPDKRCAWAGIFGWSRWAVVRYDPKKQTASSEMYHASGDLDRSTLGCRKLN